eukprot:135668_1
MHHLFIAVLEEQHNLVPIRNERMITNETLLTSEQLKKQSVFIIGYVRESNEDLICNHSDISMLLLSYTQFALHPDEDPANVITTDEINLSNHLRLEGNTLFTNHQYYQAIIKYNAALTFNLNDYRIRCNRSLCYFLLNQLDAANSDADAAVTTAPTDPKCWYRYAAVAERLNEISIAYVAYRTAVDILREMNCQNDDIKRKFNNIKKKINKRKYRTHKLWVQYFDDYNVKDAFRLKFNYCLHLTRLSRKQFRNVETRQLYNDKFMELVKCVKRSKAVKYLLYKPHSIQYRSSIDDIQTKHNWSWCVSYATHGPIYGNKRLFKIDIFCQQTGFIELFEQLFCKPTATQIIYAILKAIVHPFTTIQYKPAHILIANRLKNEFHQITYMLFHYGISCSLERRERAVISSSKHNTDVDGYNYHWNTEKKLEKKNKCCNWKCSTRNNQTVKKHRKLMVCSQCKYAKYCSRICQKYDWKHRHKFTCAKTKILQQITENTKL